MTGNMVRNNKKGNRVFPFLIRFAQKCTSEDAASGDKQPPPHTLITEVRRETTDDR
jgi:hypothetical protein